MEVFGEDEN